MAFLRRKENFTCEVCGEHVFGDGYTNHCPKCLWSKHVDVHPGDRASDCCGMMDAISAEENHGEMILTHRCIVCGHQKRNKVEKADNYDKIILLSANQAS
ncbi:MAG: hypothetical protein COV07_01020 [Candidatus Vogelbacteria bacterium CG10_big_fil_rev_8_21_14_0_10_45_14]|uniref:RNHCP domain-containing protein n=1 Tax=Candidatus Vogelbacteria bacterium CG10_big_fil_rev_8_21_14_0_10_45_14 TaxID=1975042 RepID=A0A2H0RKK0_9BACT|nr:MAG: hypothetical protein COV07_01020 [Candidatus Vogelbacteria bacterium CG10_big_fil_rev_8_21_14_0_10_45_14]